MARRLVLAALLACSFGVAGCANDESCDASVTFAYTCEPQAEPANACAGGPMLDGTQHDPDLYYPVGCFAGTATCSGDEQQVAHDCECISGFAGNSWACTR